MLSALIYTALACVVSQMQHTSVRKLTVSFPDSTLILPTLTITADDSLTHTQREKKSCKKSRFAYKKPCLEIKLKTFYRRARMRTRAQV